MFHISAGVVVLFCLHAPIFPPDAGRTRKRTGWAFSLWMNRRSYPTPIPGLTYMPDITAASKHSIRLALPHPP